MAYEEHMTPIDVSGKKEEAPEVEHDVTSMLEDPVELEVVDDTPEKDRDRMPIKAVPDPTEQEIEEYSEDVKKKMLHLKHGYHDERRAKEAAIRERDEAANLTRQLLEEKKQLQSRYSMGEQAYIAQAKEHTELAISAAKRKYKEAYEAGDGEAMADAQAELARATMRNEEANRWRPTPQVEEKALQTGTEGVQRQSVAQPEAPKPDEAAVRWAKKNEWFGQNKVMTGAAYGIHDELVAEGIQPDTDAEEYYSRLNKRLRETFPTHEWGDKPAAKPSPSVVAPVNRSPAKARKVTLTKTQISLAQRLGITPELYAKEMVKLEKSNG